MRALVLSDIHGNLEGLEAVLAHAGQVDKVWNLGDIVGYGGSPNEVVERIQSIAHLHVRGNHDRVCCGLTSSLGFNPVARAAAIWTQSALTPEHLEWLKTLPQGPLQPENEDINCAHGSPLDEDEYILSMRDAWAPLQQMTARITFIGHTHIQGGYVQQGNGWREIKVKYFHRDRDEEWILNLEPECHYLINPGSVGQPRDGDWRPGYLIYDTDKQQIVFNRVPYDLQKAQGQILMAGLPERLASRLRDGR